MSDKSVNIITVHIEGDPGIAYHNFSNRFNKKVSPILYEHMTTECVTGQPNTIRIYNDILMKNDTRRNLLKESIQNTLHFYHKKNIKEIYSCLISGIIYFLIATAITSIGIFWTDTSYLAQYVLGLSFLTAVGFGWGSLEKLLFQMLRLQKTRRILLSLLVANIEFVPLPPPLLASK